VGHEVAQRDRALRRSQFWFALGVKAFQHLRLGEIGEQRSDRRVERQLALFDQLHGAGRCHRLRHRGDPEHAICRHRIGLGQVALAERALIQNVVAAGGDRNNAGNVLGVACLAQNLVDLGFALHPRFLRFDYCWKSSIVLPHPLRGKRDDMHPSVAMS